MATGKLVQVAPPSDEEAWVLRAGRGAGAEAEADADADADAECENEAFEKGRRLKKSGLAEVEDQSRSHRPTVQPPPPTTTPTRAPTRAPARARGARAAAAPTAKPPLHAPVHGEVGGPPGDGELGYDGSGLQEPSFEIRLRDVT